MTRARTKDPENVPNELMAEYYQQRSTAGLIITEGTQISKQGQGYGKTPGIYSKEQVEGWKIATKAVKERGGKFFLQLWHVGAVGNKLVNGKQPIAPSVVERKGVKVYHFLEEKENGDATFVDIDTPREMTQEDIDQVIAEFEQGAKNAIEAGFDGVEIHGANGYLLDQFLRADFNKRSDKYGPTREKRVRLIEEVTKAVVGAVGKDRVGIRFSPYIAEGVGDEEMMESILLAAEKLEKIGIAYIHIADSDFDLKLRLPLEWRQKLRKAFSGTIISTGAMTPELGESLIEEDVADIIGFGRNFLANPDYPKRVEQEAEIQPITDYHTLFGGGG
eukprot:CAMPEP_0117422406 /NCGR_PEP_ID=MMETSP0758-20121206/3253_1 /TAXON_ID=63605 /ORGANISM="Percolomonas cosmopolitus, Strain AE-1 (ATCC 50343)" /LENGTH=332 /DNA_ID=CAMNT_0005205009 /DNA_START=62 /DNA_END=1057 /DNA_ORIENTATION=+